MGPASVGVCLPRAWVNARGLSVGAAIHVRTLANGSVYLFDDRRQPLEHANEFDVAPGSPPEHLFRRLLGSYLAGAQEFEIREHPSLRRETIAVARTFCRRTVQPEVVSEDGDSIRLRDVIDESPVPLHKLVARMGQVVLEFQQEAAASWSTLTIVPEHHWTDRDDIVDRQAWFIQRLAMRSLETSGVESGREKSPVSALGYWTIARSLERIADHAVILGATGGVLAESALPKNHLVALQQFHEQALSHLRGALSAVANPSDGAANGLLDGGEALIAVGHALSDRLLHTVSGGTTGVVTAVAVSRILESIDRTIAYAQDVAQVALDRQIGVAATERLPHLGDSRRYSQASEMSAIVGEQQK
jgi:phosphate uptake regulator